MTNITMAIDDKLLKDIRAFAKRSGTTVNAIVRQKLADLVGQEERIEEARRGLIELMDNSTGRLPKGYKFNREALYEPPTLSGHKRVGLRSRRKAG